MQLILEPREYQQDLFGRSVEQNTLIILPTGLGKTALVAYLAYYHWKQDDTKKIIMATPTKPLVFQAAKMLQEYLDLTEDEVIAVTGEINAKKRVKLYENATIIVGTPQTLSNDLLYDRLDLKHFSFLAFDEAHRATGNYAYVKILKLAEDLDIASNLHIVGFTATPGNTREQILEILHNLKISNVLMKTSSDLDVRKYSSIHEPVVEWIDLPTPYKEAIKMLDRLKKDLIKELKELGVDIDSKYINKSKIIQLQNMAFKMANEDENYGKVLFITPNLIRILHLVEMLETQGPLQAKQTLESWINKEGKQKTLRDFLEFPEIIRFRNTIEKLRDLHPKLPAMQKILKEYIDKNPSSKVIVFTNYRKTAKLIKMELDKTDLISEVFVGKAPTDGMGMSQKKQIKTLDDFKTGDLDILIATSVGEEGLDVGACDLVVFFDSVPSIVRSIQREGRGRKKLSKVIRLITKGTKDAGMYYAVKKKQRRMEVYIKRELPSLLKTLNPPREKMEKKSGLLAYIPETPESRVEINPVISNQFNKTITESDPDLIESKTIDSLSPDKQEEKTSFQPGRIVVLVDTRESASIIPRILRKEGVTIIPRVLAAGDYQVSERCIIERKTTVDFVDSLVDGRLFQQAATKLVNFDKVVMIVEGEWSYVKKQVKETSILGALSTILLDFRIPVIMSHNAVETAKYILSLAKREQREKKKVDPMIILDQGDFLVPDIQKMVLASIPGINRRKAENILIETKTLREVANMDEKELAKIPGVGKVLSKRIEKIFTNNFDGDDVDLTDEETGNDE
ncbi:MAG: ERCC4 domain-containing protein [Candidatus Hodarchaeales archaeon]|jgi:Fanconi anemia group M protein